MTADAFYTDEPEPRDRDGQDHAAEDARDERAGERRADGILAAAGLPVSGPNVALMRHTADAMDRILADVQHPAVAELARVLPVFHAAADWRWAELTDDADTYGLLQILRDVVDRACGLGIGQRDGAL